MSDEEVQIEAPQEQAAPAEQAPVAVESAPASNPFEDLAQKLEDFEQRLTTLEGAVQPDGVPSLLSRLETTDTRLTRLELAAQPPPLSDGLIAHIATLAYQQMEEQLRAQLGLSTKQPARG